MLQSTQQRVPYIELPPENEYEYEMRKTNATIEFDSPRFEIWGMPQTFFETFSQNLYCREAKLTHTRVGDSERERESELY